MRPNNKPGPPMHASSVPQRPDGRGTPTHSNSANRPSHALPTRPDSQASRIRPTDRPVLDRPPEASPHGRYDSRGPPGEYGRLDRSGDASRLREASPGRRGRNVPDGRTPERLPTAVDHREWVARDPREYDDRAMRAPPRDTRGPPSRMPTAWDSRDSRDPRDQRDRPDSRGHIAPVSMEPRRMPSSTSLAPEQAPPRREGPSHRPNVERGNGPLRGNDAAVNSPAEGPMVNPARAALINEVEHAPIRGDRENRRERVSRPQSPHRGEDRRGDNRQNDDRPPQGYLGRNENVREYRDERFSSQAPFPNNRDRRDDATIGTPTGPRGGRPDSSASRASREMFQPSQVPRPSGHQVQDPNYGRLNQPSDPIPSAGPPTGPPSGPRSKLVPLHELPTITDSIRRATACAISASYIHSTLGSSRGRTRRYSP